MAPNPDKSADQIAESAALLRRLIGEPLPRVAVVLGSGWGPLADALTGAADTAYADLPAFPLLAVGGHTAKIRFGRLGGTGSVGGRDVWVLAGRKHPYETGDADGMKGPVRTLAALGVDTLVLTNAAGSLDPAMRPGSLMLINDHINLIQRSPLIGEKGDGRFVDMNNAYCPHHRATALAVAKQIGQPLYEGVYAWLLGPQFETPAEIRMVRMLGAQAVGMSTVPETILARHAGMRVLGLSLMTNMAAGMEAETLSHAHTMATAQGAAASATALLAAVVPALEL